MNLLRWILLAAGAILFLGIYWWGRRNRASVAEQPQAKLQTRNESAVHTLAPLLHEEVSVRGRGASFTESVILTDSSVDSSRLPAMSAHGATLPLKHDALIEPTLDALDEIPNEVRASQPTPAAAKSAPAGDSSGKLKRVASQRKIVALRLAAGPSRIDGARLKALFDAGGLSFGRYNIYHRMHDQNTPLFSVASMVEPGTFEPQAMAGMQFPGITLFMQLPGPFDGQEMLTQMLDCARQLEQGIGGALQDERGLPLTDPRVQRLRDDVANFLHLLGSV